MLEVLSVNKNKYMKFGELMKFRDKKLNHALLMECALCGSKFRANDEVYLVKTSKESLLICEACKDGYPED